MPICKMCSLSFDKLANAHIIPRAFYEYCKKDRKDNLIVYSEIKGDVPIKSNRIGIYDDNLVCLECEKKFHKCDDYAIKILLKKESDYKYFSERGINYWYLNKINKTLFKDFILSLLWRAGSSESIYFNAIKLGPYLDVIKDMFLKKISDKNNYVTYIITKFNDPLIKKSITKPYPLSNKTLNGLNGYCFHLSGGYYIYIKVDKRQNEVMDYLNNKEGLVILEKNDSATSESNLMICSDIVKKAHVNMEIFKSKYKN